jgi:hypothetical protein
MWPTHGPVQSFTTLKFASLVSYESAVIILKTWNDTIIDDDSDQVDDYVLDIDWDDMINYAGIREIFTCNLKFQN